MRTFKNVEDLLRQTTYRTMDIENFLDPNGNSWAHFDSELGYALHDVVMKDGLDRSLSEYTYGPSGARKMVHYADRPCRINTYGDSFTMCHQVSDGESWQEVLAAHLREPIRNFGVGGYGVYQAYRRARRAEPTEHGAEYVILNIFEDDHYRNIDAARWIRGAADTADLGDKPRMMSGIPWVHLRFDPSAGAFIEQPSPTPTEAVLRELCDPDPFYDTFKDDQVVRLFTLQRGGEVEEIGDLEAMAEAFGMDVDLRSPAKRGEDAGRLHIECALRSTVYIVEQMSQWLESLGKKLMVLLSYGVDNVRAVVGGGEQRFDQSLVDCLDRSGLAYVDGLRKAVEDFRCYSIPLEEYMARLYISPAEAAWWGHYNPAGNHLFAFWVKDALVEWLDPPPPAYADEVPETIKRP